jgi:hypothetical protein
MPALLRSRLTLLAVVASLGAALPACGTDEAVQNDAEDAQKAIDENAGNLDEDAKDAAKDAADEIEQGLDDVDGK